MNWFLKNTSGQTNGMIRSTYRIIHFNFSWKKMNRNWLVPLHLELKDILALYFNRIVSESTTLNCSTVKTAMHKLFYDQHLYTKVHFYLYALDLHIWIGKNKKKRGKNTQMLSFCGKAVGDNDKTLKCTQPWKLKLLPVWIRVLHNWRTVLLGGVILL